MLGAEVAEFLMLKSGASMNGGESNMKSLRGEHRGKNRRDGEGGQPIGQIGSSGNTSEPHLHIHAVRIGGKISPERLLHAGAPVPLLVEGRFLVRNDTF